MYLMKRAVSISILIAVALCAWGCSSPTADNSSTAAQATPPLAASEFTDANAALAEGIKLLDTGDTDRAIEILNRAVELNPDLADAYFQLGIAYSLIETRDAAVVEEQVTPTPSQVRKSRERNRRRNRRKHLRKPSLRTKSASTRTNLTTSPTSISAARITS